MAKRRHEQARRRVQDDSLLVRWKLEPKAGAISHSRRTAQENKDLISSDADQRVIRNFYVDDW